MFWHPEMKPYTADTSFHFSFPRLTRTATLLCTAYAALLLNPEHALADSNNELVEQGRYIARIAGCNDCHTPGYMESGGKVPEDIWLTGDVLGWYGPWGTTYASNLRLILPKMTEAQWLTLAKSTQFRPPMPWFALRDMSERDLRALYQLVKQLGPAGNPAPAYLPPERTPNGPYVQFPSPPLQKNISR
jgi:mono/diheme cytochrome c family protein